MPANTSMRGRAGVVGPSPEAPWLEVVVDTIDKRPATGASRKASAGGRRRATRAPADEQLGLDARLVGEHEEQGDGVLADLTAVGVGAGARHRQLVAARDRASSSTDTAGLARSISWSDGVGGEEHLVGLAPAAEHQPETHRLHVDLDDGAVAGVRLGPR